LFDNPQLLVEIEIQYIMHEVVPRICDNYRTEESERNSSLCEEGCKCCDVSLGNRLWRWGLDFIWMLRHTVWWRDVISQKTACGFI